MIVAKLYGGLANQMFQYAAGKAASLRLNTNLYLDISWFEEIKGNTEIVQRVCELDGFGIQVPSISLRDKLSIKIHPPAILREEGFHYQKGYEKLTDNTMLDGYWQSYKYFIDFNEAVIADFKFPDRILREDVEVIKLMRDTESVAVHIRRGDYNTARGRNFHGLLPLSYYMRALFHLSKAVSSPQLFLFSDDIKWCKETIDLGLPIIFIDSNRPTTGVEDMRLMSSCKHIIMANSSFSWWSAWLNKNPDKLVYAPNKWFADKTLDTKDLIPLGWNII